MLDYPEDVLEELNDPRFATRMHYSRSTYAMGCHGPLCRRAERDRERKRTEARALAAGREYIPNMTAREVERDALLNRIIGVHLMQHEEKRLRRRDAAREARFAAAS